LILLYGYSEKRIRQFVSITKGANKSFGEADIIVDNDDELTEPY
jgi:hypothetical protein